MKSQWHRIKGKCNVKWSKKKINSFTMFFPTNPVAGDGVTVSSSGCDTVLPLGDNLPANACTASSNENCTMDKATVAEAASLATWGSGCVFSRRLQKKKIQCRCVEMKDNSWCDSQSVCYRLKQWYHESHLIKIKVLTTPQEANGLFASSLPQNGSEREVGSTQLHLWCGGFVSRDLWSW